MSRFKGILHMATYMSFFISGMQGRRFVVVVKFRVHFFSADSTANLDILFLKDMFKSEITIIQIIRVYAQSQFELNTSSFLIITSLGFTITV